MVFNLMSLAALDRDCVLPRRSYIPLHSLADISLYWVKLQITKRIFSIKSEIYEADTPTLQGPIENEMISHHCLYKYLF